MDLNQTWETYLLDNGADFVRFVDTSPLPPEITNEYSCAVLFGRILSKNYLKCIGDGVKPERDEFSKAEHAMDALVKKLAEKLTLEGHKSVTGIKSVRLPHKTIARLAGLGFIGKNTLLVTEDYGCGLALGKVLTAAPFTIQHATPIEPQCGDCKACADVCEPRALSGKMWSLTTSRDEMLTRKLCTFCLLCMVNCPYTVRYMES